MVLEDELKLVIHHRYFSLPNHNYILTLSLFFIPYPTNFTLTLILPQLQFYPNINPDFDY